MTFDPHKLRHPKDGTEVPVDKTVHINTVPGEMEAAPDEEVEREIEEHGRAKEPEIGREASP